jgi:formylglycine-generating enzyme required for sulfatase activity
MGNAAYAAPVHTVNVTGFLMSTYEVTQEQYQTVTGQTPSRFSGTNLPVERVTWFDAVEFCNKFSEQEGLESVYTITNRTPATGYPITSADVTMDITRDGYRLPTEAEWEYAVRGGNGSPDNHSYAGSDTIGAVAWYEANSGNVSHPVGTKAQNSLGLYDMSGNLWEWCWDWIAGYTASAQDDPTGPASGTTRVTRGGSWAMNDSFCHTDTRFSFFPFDRFDAIGFRIVRRP